jgi:hypothetical protein
LFQSRTLFHGHFCPLDVHRMTPFQSCCALHRPTALHALLPHCSTNRASCTTTSLNCCGPWVNKVRQRSKHFEIRLPCKAGLQQHGDCDGLMALHHGGKPVTFWNGRWPRSLLETLLTDMASILPDCCSYYELVWYAEGPYFNGSFPCGRPSPFLNFCPAEPSRLAIYVPHPNTAPESSCASRNFIDI